MCKPNMVNLARLNGNGENNKCMKAWHKFKSVDYQNEVKVIRHMYSPWSMCGPNFGKLRLQDNGDHENETNLAEMDLP